jgi:hypothetical protein
MSVRCVPGVTIRPMTEERIAFIEDRRLRNKASNVLSKRSLIAATPICKRTQVAPLCGLTPGIASLLERIMDRPLYFCDNRSFS